MRITKKETKLSLQNIYGGAVFLLDSTYWLKTATLVANDGTYKCVRLSDGAVISFSESLVVTLVDAELIIKG